MTNRDVRARKATEAQLIDRAMQDAAFRAELLADPKAVFARELGLDVPDRIAVQVMEETPASVYLLLPQIPMLFMGEEWGAAQPFPFFCDFGPKLASAVRKGRRAEFARFLRKNYECTDVLFRLAEHSGVVLMHGGGFGGPDWSVRVSLANLKEDTYPKIGQYLRETAMAYVKEWKASQRK